MIKRISVIGKVLLLLGTIVLLSINCLNKWIPRFFLFVIKKETYILIQHFIITEHGSSHDHSHGISRSHNRLSTLVGTDDNENDNTYRPPTAQVKRTHGHTHDASQMNMRGVFLHVLSDAVGSVNVIASALIVWLTKWQYR